MLQALVTGSLVGIAVIVFYGGILKWTLSDVAPMTRVLCRGRRANQYSTGELESFIRIAIGAALQLAFCLVLVVALDLNSTALGLAGLSVETGVYSLVLGVGEAAFATFLGFIAVQVGLRLLPSRTPTDTNEWLALARSGWMRVFLQAFEAQPAFAGGLTVLYIAVEEVIFRAVFITVLLPLGVFAALVVPVLFFAVVQSFQMPSWHAAMFPMIGALVVGVTHGALFLAVPMLIPLILAHAVFFVVSTA